MKFTEFMKSMCSTNMDISSKRVCGFIGWIICMFVLVFCTITNTEAPEIFDIAIITSGSLLGLDTVTAIWKGNVSDKDKGKIGNMDNLGTAAPKNDAVGKK